MKRIDIIFKITLIIILTSLTIISCKRTEKESATGEILKGDHELRRFKTTTKDESSFSGSYFLIAASTSGKTTKNTKATFTWLMNNGEYAISEIELQKIRIRIDSTADIPYVKFHWIGSNSKNLKHIFSYYVNYMVIVCKEEDYPMEIDLDNL